MLRSFRLEAVWRFSSCAVSNDSDRAFAWPNKLDLFEPIVVIQCSYGGLEIPLN